MKCCQSHCFAEHKTVRRGWFIAALYAYCICCNGAMAPVEEDLKTWNHKDAKSSQSGCAFWAFCTSCSVEFFPCALILFLSLPDYFPMLPLSLLCLLIPPPPPCPSHPLSLFLFSFSLSQIKTVPCFFSQIQVRGEQGGSEVVFVVKLTCAVFMSRESLCLGSTVCLTHSFVMHWSLQYVYSCQNAVLAPIPTLYSPGT